MNQNSKTWNADDYLTGYCNLGNKDYIKYREFKDTYDIGHNECMTILTGKHNKSQVDVFIQELSKLKITTRLVKLLKKKKKILFD